MRLEINTNSFFVFDLDDTLFQEIDFLKSAYRHIANVLQSRISCDLYEEMYTRYQRKENVFLWIISQYGRFIRDMDINWFLREYREHLPEIQLRSDATLLLQSLREASVPMGLVTDGRSITQRNKLKALGIETFFQDIIISEEFGSEKPDARNFQYFENRYPGKKFFFIGDNPTKDFIVPLELGWTTVCVKNCGHNIHEQDFDRFPKPHYILSSLQEIEFLLPSTLELAC
jgi:putative hydrolase of the HAD superfamily